jgi:hypothetical protein
MAHHDFDRRTFLKTVGLGATALAAGGCATGATQSAPAFADDGKPIYTVRPASGRPGLDGDWAGPIWREANTATIENFSATSSAHRPVAQAKVVYDDAGLYVHFRVQDQYVRSIATEYRGDVWEDACAEFFVQPRVERGYFNFEVNCGGYMLLSYHENKEWKGESLRKGGGVPWELASHVNIWHSMPHTTDPEIAEPVTWQIEYHIPFSLFEAYLGPLGEMPGQKWRANFYKIAENNSHPHYGAWSPILKNSSFHQPRYFGHLRFE